MPILVLEEPRLGRRGIIATCADSQAIAFFWRRALAEAAAAVQRFEAEGDEIMAALERAERDRLRRVAGLFGGEGEQL